MEKVLEQIESFALWEGMEIIVLYWYEDTVLYVYNTEENFDKISVSGFQCFGYSITDFANKLYQSESFLFSMMEYGNSIKKPDFPYEDYFNETASLKEHWKKASRLFSSMKRSKTWNVQKLNELLWHVESLEWISLYHKPSPLSLEKLLEIQPDPEIAKCILEAGRTDAKRVNADAQITDYVELQLQAYRCRLQNVRISRKKKTELVQWVNGLLKM